MARNITYQQAINEALAQEMERDETVVLMGEDIAGGMGAGGEEDAWGGVLGSRRACTTASRGASSTRRSASRPTSARRRERPPPGCAPWPSVPLLVVWGEQDRIIPAEHARHVPEGAEVHVLEGSGHSPHMEAAGDVNRVMERFLASV